MIGTLSIIFHYHTLLAINWVSTEIKSRYRREKDVPVFPIWPSGHIHFPHTSIPPPAIRTPNSIAKGFHSFQNDKSLHEEKKLVIKDGRTQPLNDRSDSYVTFTSSVRKMPRSGVPSLLGREKLRGLPRSFSFGDGTSSWLSLSPMTVSSLADPPMTVSSRSVRGYTVLDFREGRDEPAASRSRRCSLDCS